MPDDDDSEAQRIMLNQWNSFISPFQLLFLFFAQLDGWQATRESLTPPLFEETGAVEKLHFSEDFFARSSLARLMRVSAQKAAG